MAGAVRARSQLDPADVLFSTGGIVSSPGGCG
jgi:hypothetical protein